MKQQFVRHPTQKDTGTDDRRRSLARLEIPVRKKNGGDVLTEADLRSRDVYVEELFAGEDAGLRGIRRRIAESGRDGLQINASEGRTLQVLMKAVGAERAVEFGTFLGYSGVWIARGLAPRGHLWTCEKDPELARLARLGFEECRLTDQVTVLTGEAPAILDSVSLHAPFDFVFLDANKSGYLQGLEWAKESLRAGGLLVADNVFLFGHAWHEKWPSGEISESQWRGMRDFNKALADTSAWTSVILPTSEGLAIAIKS